MRLVFALVFLPFILQAQYELSGHVVDEEGLPYFYLPVKIEQLNLETFTDSLGHYVFTNLPVGKYAISFDHGYDKLYKLLEIPAIQNRFDIIIHRQYEFDEITIKANRWGASHIPSTQILETEKIQNDNKVLDIPSLLQFTNNASVQTDAGIGIGYAGLRYRGIDPSHVQISLNGIPLNDAESSLAYFVDIPDALSTTEDISIFKGFVPGRAGPGAFGAAVDFNMNKFHLHPFVHADFSLGSYNSQKYAVIANTGLIENYYQLECRVSKQTSDGFIDRSSSNLKSFFLSGAKVKKNYGLRLNVFFGNETTGQAWNGVPEAYLNIDSLYRFNFAGIEKPIEPYKDEKDHYKQSHGQLFYTKSHSLHATTNIIFNFTHGAGFYENYKSNQRLIDYTLVQDTPVSDLIVQKWLKNNFLFLQWNNDRSWNNKIGINYGAYSSYYGGDHFGRAIWSSLYNVKNLYNSYYANKGTKWETGLFAKGDFAFMSNWHLGLDFNARIIHYQIKGNDDQYGEINNLKNYFLFNPKMYTSYRLSNRWQLNFCTGHFEREAFREDILQNSNAKKESYDDIELDLNYKNKQFAASVNFYNMAYHSQLVYNGKLSNVGEPLKENVGQSRRAGIEMALDFSLKKYLNVIIHQAFNNTNVTSYITSLPYYDASGNLLRFDNITFHNTNLSFSPRWNGSIEARVITWQKRENKLIWFTNLKTISKQYSDNTSAESSSIPSYQVLNSGLQFEFSLLKKYKAEFWLTASNLFDEKYSSHAWIYTFRSDKSLTTADDPYLIHTNDNNYVSKAVFPQALRNYFWGLRIKM